MDIISVDEAGLRKAINAYLNYIDSYNQMIQNYVSANISALEERISKLQSYNEL